MKSHLPARINGHMIPDERPPEPIPLSELASIHAELAQLHKVVARFSTRLDEDPIAMLERRREILDLADEISNTCGRDLLMQLLSVLHWRYVRNKETGEE